MTDTAETQSTSSPIILAFAWLAVGLPLAWGVYQTLVKVALLFK